MSVLNGRMQTAPTVCAKVMSPVRRKDFLLDAVTTGMIAKCFLSSGIDASGHLILEKEAAGNIYSKEQF